MLFNTAYQAIKSRLISKRQKFNRPLLSVIMPVFNIEKYLELSICSVLNQSYPHFELIIVNDASTDASLEIAYKFQERDCRVKVINLRERTLGGAGIPSNIGLSHAKGEYIAFVDGDDFLDPMALERLLDAALKSSAEIVIADFCTFGEDETDRHESYDKKRWKGIPKRKPFDPVKYSSVCQLSPVPWRKLYKTSFIRKHNIFFPEGDFYYEDNVFHWLCLLNARRVMLIDHVVACHRVGRDGQTTTAGNEKLLAHLQHIETITNYMNQKKSTSHIFWKELLLFAYRTYWVVEKQDATALKERGKRQYAEVLENIIHESCFSNEYINRISPRLLERKQACMSS